MAEKPTYEELENRVNELMVERNRLSKVEAELNRSIRFTQSLLSAIPTPIFFKDDQGRYQGCNPAFTEIMGVAAQDLRGKTVQELWPSEHADVYHQKDIELMLHPKRQIYEFKVKDKNGTIRPVIFYKNVFHDEHGNVAGLVGGFVDITERKRTEDTLNKSERKYRQLFERSTDAIFIVDKSTGRYLDANAAAEELTGYPVSVLKNLTTHEVTPKGAKQRLQAFESSKESTEYGGVVYVRPDGSKRIAKLSIIPLDNEAVYGIAHDITESKEAEKRLRDSELKFRNIVNSSPMGIHLYELRENDRLVFIGANPAADRILGFDHKQFFGNTIEEAFHGLIDTEVPARYRDAAKNGSIWRTEQISYNEDMISGVFEVVAFQIEPGKMATFFNEITARKRAKEELQESERKYRSLANNLNVGIYRNSLGPKGRFIEANPAIVQMFGFDSRDEFLKVKVSDLYMNPKDRIAYNSKLLRKKEIRNEALQLRKKDGASFIGSISAVVVKDKEGQVKYYDGIIEDITERKLAEKSLQQSEEKYRHLFETAMVGIYRTRIEDGKFIDANQVLAKMLGYQTVDALVSGYVTSEHYIDPSRREMLLNQIATNGKVDGFEIEMKRADGSPINIELSATVYPDKGYLEGVIIDTTERVKTESELKESEERYRAIVEDNTQFIVRWKPDGTRTFANRSYCKYLGKSYADVIGTNIFDDIIEQDREQLRQTVSSLSPGNPVAYTHERKSSEVDQIVWQEWVERGIFDKHDRLFEIQSVGHDITDLRKAEAEKVEAEEKLRQAQKMEAIGTLAGGIAHDFNNILSAILGYSELALADLPSDSLIRNKLEAIHSSGERARDLVAQILAFSRKDEHVRSPVEIHLIIEDALKLLRPAIPTTIEIQTRINSKCRIFGDPSRIHQIIMNLCTNAYQAMLETGGTLSITLSHEQLKGKVAVLAHVPAGVYGKLVISDTGVGIPSENLERIFDPYFTTKEKGKGTGLGLAAVHGICKSHGGSIFVESQLGQGTKFTMYLPLTLDRSDTAKNDDRQLPGGNEHILLVDDEQDIRDIEKEMLEIQGYQVTVKDSAQGALKLFTKQPEQFDLVITDMTMPNMTGDKLAEEIIKIRSDVPIILNTGYSEIITKEKAKSLGIRGFLMKPVTMRDLSNTIRKVLDDNEGVNRK